MQINKMRNTYSLTLRDLSVMRQVKADFNEVSFVSYQ